ncbi:MAG: hypothetical protein NXI32_09625 [bacterium]|nr:hypothetical protein [bacterium]
MSVTPADLLAMVLYILALVYVAAGNEPEDTADLDAVLPMNEALGFRNLPLWVRSDRYK